MSRFSVTSRYFHKSLEQVDESWIQFWKLLEPEHARAQAFCGRLAGNPEDGDDLYQDALVRALPAFDSLKDQAAFKSWLYRIIVNLYKSHVSRPWWRRFLPLTPELAERATGDNPIGHLTARRRLEVAFGALSPGDKALVTLKEIEGWSIADLAAMTGRSEGSIKVRLCRAREAMRKRLIRYFNGRAVDALSHRVHNEDEVCVVTKPGKK